MSPFPSMSPFPRFPPPPPGCSTTGPTTHRAEDRPGSPAPDLRRPDPPVSPLSRPAAFVLALALTLGVGHAWWSSLEPPGRGLGDALVPEASAPPPAGGGLAGAWLTDGAEEADCVPRSSCCRVCRKGKACGDSCIQRRLTCHKDPGCACDAEDLCGETTPGLFSVDSSVDPIE